MKYLLFVFAVLMFYFTATEVGELLAPKFISVYNTDCFDHTSGKWDIETGRKIKR